MSVEKDTYFDCSFVSIHYIICECGETFPSENGLRAHLEKEHPHKRERKEFKCGVCGSIFLTEDDCINHYEEKHIVAEVKKEEESEEETKPDILEEVEEPNIEIVMEPDPEPMEAEEAEVQENEESQLLHIPEEFGEMIEQDEQLIFLVADRRGRASRPRKLKCPKDIVCEVCGKKYASNAALRYHQRVHTGERPYKCHLCPKNFTMPLFLQIHVRTHTGERPFECKECPKAFSNKAALLRHMRVHTGEKPYECPMCYKAFTQSNSMKLHVTTVHLKQPAPYKSKTRKMRAAERLKANPVKGIKEDHGSYGLPDSEADPEPETNEDGNVYEVIESEVINDDEKECYETYEIVLES